jgi:Protein of unknown function (DUF2628)
VKVWTAHLRQDAEPVLVREGFSWGALFFGPLWLAAHRAWVPAAISLAGFILIVALAASSVAWVLILALAWLLGLSGRDLCRWSVRHRGYQETHVLVGRNETDALDRLLAARPDMVRRFAASVP